jgi:S1-C subfamily serine protease
MRAVALVLALLVASFSSIQAKDWSDVVKQVERSIVYLEGDSGACTAWVINVEKKYLMTAAHCDQKGNIYVDRVLAKVIAKDTKKDLMVVFAEDLDPTLVALRLASKNPSRGQEVMSAGYGYALERPFFRKASIQDDALMIPEGGVGGPYISTDSPFVGGQSGGPVVNNAGEVVMIVQRGDSGTTGLGVGAEIIRERMGRFFGAGK